MNSLLNKRFSPKIKRAFGSLMIMTFFIYLGFGALLNIYQYTFLYFPTEEILDDTQNYITIYSDKEILKIWVVNPNQKEAVIFFGGNASNAHKAIPQLEAVATNKTAYIVNYRGYGGSTGSPNERGMKIDALNIFDFVQDHHTNISAVGRSLGTGFATYLAANRSLKKLVLITPYDSVESVAKDRYPMYPISYLLHDKYNSIGLVPDIKEKTLILIAETDSVVPNHHAYTLASAFKPEQVTVVTLADTNHSTISNHPDYLKLIADFIY